VFIRVHLRLKYYSKTHSSSSHKPGERIKLELMREGKPLTIEAIAGERPATQPRAGRG
jgi:S1-C subfamily serine protease